MESGPYCLAAFSSRKEGNLPIVIEDANSNGQLDSYIITHGWDGAQMPFGGISCVEIASPRVFSGTVVALFEGLCCSKSDGSGVTMIPHELPLYLVASVCPEINSPTYGL